MTSKYSSHYDYLDFHFSKFCKDVGIVDNWVTSLISAHGDKGYCYKRDWEKSGIHFYHGMMLYILFRLEPFCDETEQHNVKSWVIDNYSRFVNLLPSIE